LDAEDTITTSSGQGMGGGGVIVATKHGGENLPKEPNRVHERFGLRGLPWELLDGPGAPPKLGSFPREGAKEGLDALVVEAPW
jgi:hypothetical protein